MHSIRAIARGNFVHVARDLVHLILEKAQGGMN